jgi:radical SAM protein with 4Fe4S-binding SPASM domain
MKKYSRVYVEITNICNRNCSFCPGTKRDKKVLGVEEFELICDKLVGVTEYLYLHVMGEPLTHPELPRLISLAASKGFKVSLTTNGTLLSRVGQSIIDSGVYKVNISLHSFEEGTNEEYVRYIEGCLDFADLASSLGVLTVVRLWNRGFDKGRNINTLDMLKEKFPNEWVEGASGARIRHRLHLEYGDRFDWPDMGADNLGDQVFCHGLGDHFGILSDGRVIPCCLDREGEITLGNVFETPIREILSSERALAIRAGFDKRIAVEELCQKCGYALRFG